MNFQGVCRIWQWLLENENMKLYKYNIVMMQHEGCRFYLVSSYLLQTAVPFSSVGFGHIVWKAG